MEFKPFDQKIEQFVQNFIIWLLFFNYIHVSILSTEYHEVKWARPCQRDNPFLCRTCRPIIKIVSLETSYYESNDISLLWHTVLYFVDLI
jgi:hypothetical protein